MSPTHQASASSLSRAEAGIAVLVVIGATAALAALVSITALGAAGNAAAAAHRQQATQAMWLAEIAVAQAVAALDSGAVGPPAVGVVVEWTNGVDQPSGAVTGVGAVAAPVPSWPTLTSTPDAAPIGRGARVRMFRVVGPDGEGRGRLGPSDPDLLVDLVSEVWFRSARATVAARVAMTATGAQRLH
jgi:hypothetical protein